MNWYKSAQEQVFTEKADRLLQAIYDNPRLLDRIPQEFIQDNPIFGSTLYQAAFNSIVNTVSSSRSVPQIPSALMGHSKYGPEIKEFIRQEESMGQL